LIFRSKISKEIIATKDKKINLNLVLVIFFYFVLLSHLLSLSFTRLIPTSTAMAKTSTSTSENDSKYIVSDYKPNIIFSLVEYFFDDFYTLRASQSSMLWTLVHAKMYKNQTNPQKSYISFKKHVHVNEEYLHHFGHNGTSHVNFMVSPFMNPIIVSRPAAVPLGESTTITKKKISELLDSVSKNGESITHSFGGYTFESTSDVEFEVVFTKKQNALYITEITIKVPIKTWTEWLHIYKLYKKQMAMPKNEPVDDEELDISDYYALE
jgi:hypothetical protein